MTEENPWRDTPDDGLPGAAKMPGVIGPQIEAILRLKRAVEDQTRAADAQSRASGRLTKWIMFLTIVGVVLTGIQVWAVFGRVRP